MNYTIPSAVAPGKTTSLTLVGDNFAGATELWTSFPAQTVRASASDAANSESGRVTYNVTVPADVPFGIGAIQLATTNGCSSLLLLAIDDLQTLTDNGTNSTVRTAQSLQLPIAIDGTCAELGFDYYQIDAKPGQRLSVDVVAHRLGSPLDPVIRLLDATGRELAYCDDDPGAFADARIGYEFSSAGSCLIEVRDIRYQGGAKFRYRMRVGQFPIAALPFLPVHESNFSATGSSGLQPRTEVEPNDSPAVALPIPIPIVIAGSFAKEKDRDFYEFEVEKDQRLVFAGKTRSLGYGCDLYMELRKADDSLVAEANVTGIDEGTITNTFREAGTYRLLVEELNRQGGPGFGYRLEVAPQPAGFALSVDSDKFVCAAGGTFDFKVTCLRRDYAGPIELSLGGSAKGFVLADNIISGKTNGVQMKVTVPADLAAGHLVHFTLQGRAKIGEATFETQASTLPAIRKLFPQMLYPPLELDGLLALGVKPARKPEATSGSNNP